MTQEVDVLIIGAGPAGLSAGIVFARNGIRTIVCEQKTLPVDKVCGEGVMPTGLAHLQRLGVLKFLSPSEYIPFRGVRYISNRNFTAQGCFREGPGWGIPRLALSQAFVKRAVELESLDILESTRAEPQTRMKDRIAVRVGDELVFTRLLVGADGLSSKVRRWAGLDGVAHGLQRWGTRQHFSMSPWIDLVEIYWGEGVEAYITPCGKKLTSLAILWDRHRYRGIEGGRRLMDSLLAGFPNLEDRFKGAEPFDTPMSIGPMHRSATSPVGEGVILVGDAAGYLDALTGEGISLATAQALAIEKNIIPLFKNKPRQPCLLTSQQLESYRRAYREIVRPYYRMTRLALMLNRHSRLAEYAIRLLHRQPGLFSSILSANMGTLERA